MMSWEPVIRRCRSSESTEGTMRSLSPLAIRVGWVIFDRSAGAERPHRLDRLELSLEGLDADLRVSVRGPFFQPFDECAGGALADVIAVEEQVLLGVLSGEGRTQRVVIGCPGDLVDILSACGSGSGEDQLADQFGVLEHQCLGDHPAEREGEDIDGGEAECGDEGVGVVGHRLDGVGNSAGGGTDAAVVERDDVVLLGDRVDDPRVPVVQRGGEVDEEDDGDAALGAEFAIGVGDSPGVDRQGGRLSV